ncbi:MAG: Ldh family oxidoreductase [Caldilineaceae bacterium]
MPAGGPKGSGLALMFQALTSILAGNPLITPRLNDGVNVHNQNSVVAAIDIGLFTDPADFKQEVDDTIDALKRLLPCADVGFDDVLMPGEPERCPRRTQRQWHPPAAGYAAKTARCFGAVRDPSA